MFRLKESRLPDGMKEEYGGMPKGMFRPRPVGLPEYSLRSPFEVHGEELEIVESVASMLAMARVGLEFDESEIARQAARLAFAARYMQVTPETVAEALFHADLTTHEPWRQAANEGKDDGDYGVGVLAPTG